MNNAIDETFKLKRLIEQSEEYMNYEKTIKLLEKNKKINYLINSIKKLQKEIVQKEVKKINVEKLEEKLNFLFDELYDIPLYNDYLQNSKKLNKLITKIQKKFENNFNKILE